MHMSPGQVADERRVAAATIWYAKGLICRGQGAEIAGMSRADSMQALSMAGVSPFQETRDEVQESLRACLKSPEGAGELASPLPSEGKGKG
jgi:hypothetical protein